MARLTPIELRGAAVLRRQERRLARQIRELARYARAEERARKAEIRAFAKTSKAARREAERILKRGALFTRQTTAKLRAAAPRIERVRIRERDYRETRRPLTPIEQRWIRYAIPEAAALGKEIPAGIYGYMQTHPAVARQWIAYYMRGEGNEPPDIDEATISAYFARYHATQT